MFHFSLCIIHACSMCTTPPTRFRLGGEPQQDLVSRLPLASAGEYSPAMPTSFSFAAQGLVQNGYGSMAQTSWPEELSTNIMSRYGEHGTARTYGTNMAWHEHGMARHCVNIRHEHGMAPTSRGLCLGTQYEECGHVSLLLYAPPPPSSSSSSTSS